MDNKKFIFKNEKAEIFLKEIPDNSIDFILTDPPYIIDASSGGGAI